MKKLKKMMALIIAVAMVMGMSSMSVFAAAQSSITINNAVKDHTYTAYQILKGDVANGKLSNVTWGSGITDAGKTALYTKYGLTGADQTAQKVADAIAASTTTGAGTVDDSKAIEFANTVGTNVTGGSAVNCTSDGTIKIDNLEDGYYMIVDKWNGAATAVAGDDYTLARYMVQLVGTATVNNKADKPTVEKKIVEGQDKKEQNTANIGDTITYEITSKVPQYDGYKEYYMDFEDTLSKGLTYDANSLTVKIGSTTLATTEYELTVGSYDASAGTSIKVHFKDMVTRSTYFPVGESITITYTAKVNDNAVIGNGGNPNTVILKYTNNPLRSGNGTPDDTEDIPQGTTPQEKTNTFVTEIDLTKVEKGTTTALAGAVFNVKGSQINKVLVTGEHFVEDASGTYYLLTDNTYTEKVPTEETKAKYANLTGGNLPVTKKYKKEAYATTSVQETADVDFQVISDSNGKIKITGLKEGTYTFTEIQAPDGHNLLEKPIVVVISSNIDTITKAEDFKWTKGTTSDTTVTVADVAMDTTTDITDDVANGTFAFNVENASGTTLPSTGGIGTTIFYVIGTILVIGAGVVLITRRRMDA